MAVVSPSFAAPGKFPQVYELGLQRLREIFGVKPVEYHTTKKVGASVQERARDLVDAFEDLDIKAVIATTGGDDQITYVSRLPSEPFTRNLKPFCGYSDNSHLCNFLFLHGVPSYYGAGLMTQFAMQGAMDPYTIAYITHALFDAGEFELAPSIEYNDMGLDWEDVSLLRTRRTYWKNEGWYWDGDIRGEGLLWGGCVESIDDMLRNNTPIPTLTQYENIILMLETSEEIPPVHYVQRVLRALGERGILSRVKGILVGRPKAWEFDKQLSLEQKERYRQEQREVILRTIRTYNRRIPIVQNMNFGHTDPQIPMPSGGKARIEASTKKIFATF